MDKKIENMTLSDVIYETLVKAVLPILVGVGVYQTGVRYIFDNRIPRTDQVQQGFVVPSKLEIELDDLDKNGENETILNYDGRSYLFGLDENGKPIVQHYYVKSAEIVPEATPESIIGPYRVSFPKPKIPEREY